MVDKYIKSNICLAPWMAIETRPDGAYKPCCVYKDELTDPEGKKYTTKEHSITEVMNSKSMNDLRNRFLAGEKPSACDSCRKQEAAGNTSKDSTCGSKPRHKDNYTLIKILLHLYSSISN